mmetsp:Transcript_1317/g.3786  ORF Transcript_1317/g.3786 Transcript_1317/m.3786 type:complete len:288 (-) Transcript_1317:10-873(-)
MQGIIDNSISFFQVYAAAAAAGAGSGTGTRSSGGGSGSAVSPAWARETRRLRSSRSALRALRLALASSFWWSGRSVVMTESTPTNWSLSRRPLICATSALARSLEAASSPHVSTAATSTSNRTNCARRSSSFASASGLLSEAGSSCFFDFFPLRHSYHFLSSDADADLNDKAPVPPFARRTVTSSCFDDTRVTASTVNWEATGPFWWACCFKVLSPPTLQKPFFHTFWLPFFVFAPNSAVITVGFPSEPDTFDCSHPDTSGVSAMLSFRRSCVHTRAQQTIKPCPPH